LLYLNVNNISEAGARALMNLPNLTHRTFLGNSIGPAV
jgi:hypothetical protein